MSKYKVIDLFAGVGGLSYGFAVNENFEIVMANEFDKDIAKAYSLNHTNVNVIQGDIKNISQDILEEFYKQKIDVIIGGPPCQSYSTLGKRKMDDRANLFMEYYRVLSVIKPKLFIFENVSGLLSMQKGELFKLIKNKFYNLGYDLKHKILDAASYGVPQHRERIILVGMLNKNNFEFPAPIFGTHLKPYRTIKDALSDLPILESGDENNTYLSEPQNELQLFFRKKTSILTENKSPKNGPHLIKLMKSLPDGGSKEDLPEQLKPKSGYNNTYAKMWWNKPAPTITRNFATPSSSRCIHPRDSRALTTREGARLQSFPDDYKFYGSRTTKNLEIGNAVPPLLSIELAKQVYMALKNK